MKASHDYRRVLDIEASLTDMQDAPSGGHGTWPTGSRRGGTQCMALAVMVPFYRVVPLPIEVDRLTGESQVIDVLDARTCIRSEIQDKHWVEAMCARASATTGACCRWTTTGVLDMSEDMVARDYRRLYSGPDALDRQLGPNTERRVRILSTTLPPDEPGRAVVHIERTTSKHGQATPNRRSGS